MYQILEVLTDILVQLGVSNSQMQWDSIQLTHWSSQSAAGRWYLMVSTDVMTWQRQLT